MRSVEEQHSILRACHMDPTSGHMGVKRTVYRIEERFYWKGVIKDVEHTVSFINIATMRHFIIIIYRFPTVMFVNAIILSCVS